MIDRRFIRRALTTSTVALMLTSCGAWRGIAAVPLPFGPNAGHRAMTIGIQFPDTLALNVNSRVQVADAVVGSVSRIEIKDWVATVTVHLASDVELPANATASIGQTSLLGSQHIELAAPPQPSRRRLRDGDVIPLQHSSAFPTTERTLASIATIVRGGGLPHLETIAAEVNDVLTGRAAQIKEFLHRLDTFTAELDRQRHDILRAIDALDLLLSIIAQRDGTVDRVLTEFPPLIQHFADTRDLFADAVVAVGRVTKTANETLAGSRENLNRNLTALQRPLTQLGRAAPDVIGALKLILTAPFNIDDVPKVVRGDYINISGVFDFTISAFDNALLTGTGFSGALRALEQAWGRDPNTMIPDVRFAPNPADVAPERGE